MTNVIIFTFAGRKPNLDLQIPMVKKILADHPNAQWHLWNLARNDADREFVKSIEGERITVFNGTGRDGFASPAPTNEPGAKQFGANEHNAAYRRYSQKDYANHLFMKIDDDIVFLETARFGKFVEALDAHRGSCLIANIINNGACTPITPGIWEGFQKLNLPLLDIHMSGKFADMVHNYFFDHTSEMLNQPLELIPTEDWTSINAVGYDWQTLCKVIGTIGKPQPAYLAGRPMHGWGLRFGDEGVFQTIPRIIVKGFTAAHLTFGPQNPTKAHLERWYEGYRQLGEQYLASATPDLSVGLPGLSETSCGYEGVRGVEAQQTVIGQRWGTNNWRSRWLENDPTVGRFVP